MPALRGEKGIWKTMESITLRNEDLVTCHSLLATRRPYEPHSPRMANKVNSDGMFLLEQPFARVYSFMSLRSKELSHMINRSHTRTIARSLEHLRNT